MENSNILISGNKKVNTEDQSIRLYFPDAQIESYSLSAARGIDDTLETVSLAKNDVVVLEFENNIKWFYDPADFKSKIRQQQPAGRGTANDGVLVVPLQWQDAGQSRGLISGAMRLLGLNVFKNIVGEKIALSIAQRIEQHNGNILYACDSNFNLQPFEPSSVKDSSATYLLFLHGTGTTTRGSFEGLIKEQSGSAYNALYKKYEGRLLGFEHKTFTESPIENTIALLKQLPDKITLDLLSHSRGGLIGEVLARIGNTGVDGAFTKKELDLLKQNDEAVLMVAEIEALEQVIRTKQIKVNRFVRVACPAAGTTLVSDRMETILNVLFNVLSHIGGETIGTIVDGIKALLTAVVNEKNDVNTLPGIECMRPTSNFIKAINFFETKIDSDLVVISGDAQGEGFVSRIKMFLVDAFYKEDNDLVVNTASMKKGTGRTNSFSIYDERKSEVNHFNYFINATTQNIIFEAFAGKTTQSRGFYKNSDVELLPVKDAVTETTRGGKTKNNQPILYVLPGIMGSHLEVSNDRVWLNYFHMALGQLGRLKFPSADNVKAMGINGSAYKSLVDYFSNYYYVVPFAYDWRKSVFDAADALRKDIEETMAVTDKTISFVVHSMGGLVLRAFAVKHNDLWEQLSKRSNCRVLMMGTPNMGSYDVPRILLGIGKTINSLAALDLTRSKRSLLAQFIQYPGLLQLLPSKGIDDFGDLNFWNDIKNTARSIYPIPSAGDVEGYHELQKPPYQSFKWDEQVVKYIAGKDEQTPSRIEVDKANNKVNFYATPRGDGSVTWDSIPPELVNQTYYLNVEHGKLADHDPSFVAYKELLETGTTEKISRRQPATRSENKLELMPDVEPVTITNENDLSMQIMGIQVKPPVVHLQQLRISITHGDMAHACYPVVAGHFDGDGIVQAEKVLNQKLDNYFGIRYDANNYPGKIGTHEVVLNKTSHPPGGIVVGLGEFGRLTENTLATTLKQAFLTYIIENKEKNSSAENQELGISYLLIGSGFGGLTTYSSLKALLTAVNEANNFFKTNMRGDYTLISNIEIIELYQHKAVQAARIVYGLLGNSALFQNIAFSPNTIKRVSGARNEIPDEFPTEWWHRLKVYEEERKTDDAIKTRVIKFSSITDRARNEEEVLATNIAIVDKLITQAASQTIHNRQLYDTLYEMLIPNQFKGYGSDLRNIVLIVDKETARYPWEMLRDAYSGNQDPIVTKAGFLRQLSTSTYRQNAKLAPLNNALVIGNPQLNSYYPNLPGAGVEAAQVALQLKNKGYLVQDYIETQSAEIILSLYSRSYKIIHIAAHGVVNDKKTGQTGVVLGEELILTPSDFKQIREIPDLVFINCCSLGTIDKKDEERLQRKFEVAAGVGTQLIEMGVQAVIVAGWEVDDTAAQCFSENFYAALLNGKAFGEAVRHAREITYKTHPEKNTWGAYQCYGDPFYTLRPISTSSKTSEFVFCDTVEAINKLQSLVSKVEAATTRDEEEKMTAELNAINSAINVHADWVNNAYINELLAELYKELGDIKKAIELYELLFSLEDANFSVKSVEQYNNIKIKQALSDFKANEITHAKANDIIASCINHLQHLNSTPSAERFSLLGSAFRRKAEINASSIKVQSSNLLKAAENYHKAFLHILNTRGKVNYYPLYNWLIISAVISDLVLAADAEKYKELLSPPLNVEQLMSDAENYAIETGKSRPDFWSKTAATMQNLYEIIMASSLESMQESKHKILHNQQEAKEVEGSPKKLKAVKDMAGFVVNMLEANKAVEKNMKMPAEKIAVLRSLIDELED